LSGNQAAVDRVRRVPVEDFLLNQEDKRFCRSPPAPHLAAIRLFSLTPPYRSIGGKAPPPGSAVVRVVFAEERVATFRKLGPGISRQIFV